MKKITVFLLITCILCSVSGCTNSGRAQKVFEVKGYNLQMTADRTFTDSTGGDFDLHAAKQVHQILTDNNWKDEGVRRACVSIRKYQNKLGYSEQWMTEYVHTIAMLAKKEPKKNSE